MIIVEDLHDLPFMNLSIEPFELKASDWTRAVSIYTHIYLILIVILTLLFFY